MTFPWRLAAGDEATPGTQGPSLRVLRTSAPSGADDAHREARSDDRLLDRLRDGDPDAFDDVVREQFAPLVRFANGYVRQLALAEDLVQDVFVWLWERRATLAPRETLTSYLYGAVRHRALDALRRSTTEARVRERMGEHLDSETTSVLDVMSHSDDRSVLWRAVAALSERRRAALRLRYALGLSHAEVAEVLGVSPKAAKELVLRTLDALRAAVRPENG
jgi:RNA polymerase sigma-70 factor (family 1)